MTLSGQLWKGKLRGTEETGNWLTMREEGEFDSLL